MEIRTIEVEGFRSYRDYNKVDVPQGVTGIIGQYDTNTNKSNGCVTGDTLINVNRGGNGRQYTIKTMFDNFRGIKTKCARAPWNLTIPTKVRSFNGSTIKLHEIEDVVYSGVKKVYKLKLRNGFSIKATEDHKIMTKRGWVQLINLVKSKDEVMCDTLKAEKSLRTKSSYEYKEVYNIPFHKYSKKITVDNSTKKGYAEYTRLPIHRLIYEAHINGLDYEDFIEILRLDKSKSKKLKFLDPEKIHIHHKDFNQKNNNISNLEALPKKDHYRLHGLFNTKNFNQGTPKFSPVKSITFIGEEDTYDIVCKDPYRNFVANGIVIHNSGKSTLINCIVYAHYGEGEFDKIAELVNDSGGVKHMYVRITETINGNDYVVERGIKNKSSYLDFFENGVKLGEKISTAQEHINRVLGMDYEMFTSSVFSEQDNIDKFINTTPDKLRGYVDKVLGLELWRNLGKNSASKENMAKKEVKDLGARVSEMETKIKATREKIKDKDVITADLHKLSDEQTEKQGLINNLEIHKRNADSLQREENNLVGYKSKLSEIESEIDSINIEETKKRVSNEADGFAKDKEAFLASASELKLKIDEFSQNSLSINKKIQDLVSQKSEAKTTITFKQNSLNESMEGKCPKCKQEVDKALLEAENEALNKEITSLEEKLVVIESEISQYQDDWNKVESEKKETQVLLSGLQEDINKIDKSLLNLENELKLQEDKIKNLLQRESDIQTSIQQSEAFIQDFKNLLEGVDLTQIDEVDTLKKELSEVTNQINLLNRDLGETLKSEEFLKELKEDLKSLKINLKNKEKEIIIYNILGDTFRSIPKEILKDSIEFIKEYSNDIIKKIMPSISLDIYEDEEKANKPLVVSLFKNGKPRTYKSLSGGEKVVTNIGIRLGFSKIILSKAKTNIGLIVLDEPFGALDAENRGLVKQILSMLSEKFNQILIISHTDDIKDFPNIISVKMNKDEISYIN